jgi:alanyl-tRNA synthetase
MQKVGLNELREMFLAFFEGKKHLRLPGYSLIPQDDKSLLLINAGMAPLKKFFTGEATPPDKRVTTCQKCVRTPDIERVGKTSRHGTYFEMLGNFSFGDYFKREAIFWAWEFCTKVVELPAENLFISVYIEDDEAYGIWKNDIGIEENHLVRLGKEDNFWELGAGPCGPCSEIYYDRGEKYGCDSPQCAPGCDCDRYVEFWNLVFTQYENDGRGNYKNLAKRNIDTGMGLERLACIVQGVDNLFEVDTVQRIMKHVIKTAGVNYRDNENTDTSLRVITDHIRSTTFLIGDGVIPSNEGRGYVLRRLIRRALRHGRLLGVEEQFLAQISETVVEENKNAYPTLKDKQEFIKKVISNEEENFSRTIVTGLQLLGQIIETAGESVISGQEAFKLSDTFGFPLELTKEIAAEKGLLVDEEEFFRLSHEHKRIARNARKNAGEDGWKKSNDVLSSLPATIIENTANLSTKSKIEAIIKDNVAVNSLSLGDNATIVLDRSTFYAESGGQTGDIGLIRSKDFVFQILGTTKTNEGVILHQGRVVEGELSDTDVIVTAEIDKDIRHATCRNHTAAHLLHAALRTVLGKHVIQAGQEVSSKTMRFDFTHFNALTEEEINCIEMMVNDVIMSALPVDVTEMTLEQAKSSGAMALFESKYSENVRVVSAGGVSSELCGGTHVTNTGSIGLFKIISETSISSGVRRIEALTGYGVLEHIKNNEETIKNAAIILKLGNVKELEQRTSSIMSELKQKDREIEALKSHVLLSRSTEIIKQAIVVGKVKLATAVLEDISSADLRYLCDLIKDSDENMVVLLAGINSPRDTLSLAAAAAPEAIKAGANAGILVKQIAAIAGGSGGGRPDSAMAGSKKPDLANEAIVAVDEVLRKMLK